MPLQDANPTPSFGGFGLNGHPFERRGRCGLRYPNPGGGLRALDPNTVNPATVRLAQNGGSTVVATVDLSADGLTVTLSPASDLSPSTLYRVTLSADITDPAGNALAAFASSFTTAAANTPPVADAGPDQVVFVGETAFLDGGGSTDADGDALTYRWSLTTVPTGSIPALSNPAAVSPAFVADLPGIYVAQLIVNDGTEDSAPDTVTITTRDSPPIAAADLDQNVFVGETATWIAAAQRM